jgi:hypothetical protein
MSDRGGESGGALAVGQIWKEVDPRSNRFVRIVEIRSSRTAVIETVMSRIVGTRPRISKIWDSTTQRKTEAHPSRFNGKRGGYEFIEAPPLTERTPK